MAEKKKDTEVDVVGEKSDIKLRFVRNWRYAPGKVIPKGVYSDKELQEKFPDIPEGTVLPKSVQPLTKEAAELLEQKRLDEAEAAKVPETLSELQKKTVGG